MQFSEAEITQLVADDIQKGWYAQEVLAVQRQARIAKANQRLGRTHIEGMGEVQMSVDPFIYHMYGKKYGYEIWGDKEFKRTFMRDNPEVRANSKSKKIQVGYR